LAPIRAISSYVTVSKPLTGIANRCHPWHRLAAIQIPAREPVPIGATLWQRSFWSNRCQSLPNYPLPNWGTDRAPADRRGGSQLAQPTSSGLLAPGTHNPGNRLARPRQVPGLRRFAGDDTTAPASPPTLNTGAFPSGELHCLLTRNLRPRSPFDCANPVSACRRPSGPQV
jgi:hypothetical protein